MTDHYENDFNRIVALASAGVATFRGINPAPFAAKVTESAEILQALLDLGQPVPGDLAEQTGERVAEFRQGYADKIAYADAQLALPDILRERTGVKLGETLEEKLEAMKADAETWVTIIDATWPEGG